MIQSRWKLLVEVVGIAAMRRLLRRHGIQFGIMRTRRSRSERPRTEQPKYTPSAKGSNRSGTPGRPTAVLIYLAGSLSVTVISILLASYSWSAYKEGTQSYPEQPLSADDVFRVFVPPGI